MKSPIELLCVIIDKAKHERVQKVFDQFNLNNDLTIMGKGTAKTTLGDIFSFGVIDRDIMCSIVDVNISDALCNKLNDVINSNGPTGIIFTVPLDAISSDLFNLLMGGTQ